MKFLYFCCNKSDLMFLLIPPGQYGGLVSQLSNKARSIVKEMDKKNDLTCVRVQSTKYEVRRKQKSYIRAIIFLFLQLVVAPENDYILIVLREPDKSQAGQET